MISLKVVLIAGAMFVAGVASSLEAQSPILGQNPPPAPGRLDASVYIGGTGSTAWLEAKEYDFGIGYNPTVGAALTRWLTPHAGLRIHAGYIPARIPTAVGLDSLQRMSREGRPLNIWLYDLEVVGRPFATSATASRQRSSIYLWLGAGGLTVDPAGSGSAEEMGCLFPYYLGDACLSYDGGHGTVGQLTAGAGMDLFYLSENVSVFGEFGVHVYDSPFHMGPGWTRRPLHPTCRCVADDVTALTTRLVLGTKFAPPGPHLLPAPPPAAPPAPPPPPPPAALPEQPVVVCVAVDGVPRYIDAMISPLSGDTVVATNGGQRALRAAYPSRAESASGQPWFVTGDDIFLDGRPYVKFGVARALEPSDLQRVAEYNGIPIFQLRDTTAATPAKAVYLPVQDGCLFQPYQTEQVVRGVRG